MGGVDAGAASDTIFEMTGIGVCGDAIGVNVDWAATENNTKELTVYACMTMSA